MFHTCPSCSLLLKPSQAPSSARKAREHQAHKKPGAAMRKADAAGPVDGAPAVAPEIRRR
jgi:hypothetical protein